MGYTQRAHDVIMTSYQRRCDVMTSHRRRSDVIMTSCACCAVTRALAGSSNFQTKQTSTRSSSHFHEANYLKGFLSFSPIRYTKSLLVLRCNICSHFLHLQQQQQQQKKDVVFLEDRSRKFFTCHLDSIAIICWCLFPGSG